MLCPFEQHTYIVYRHTMFSPYNIHLQFYLKYFVTVTRFYVSVMFRLCSIYCLLICFRYQTLTSIFKDTSDSALLIFRPYMLHLGHRQWLELVLLILEIPVSNLSSYTAYFDWIFPGLPQFFQKNFGILPSITTWPLPSTSFLIYYLLIILSVNVM
jgi:hypothetical protein